MGHDVAFAAVDPRHRADVDGCRFHTVFDSNRNTKLGLLRTLLDVILIVIRESPDVVVSTGAAPGFIAIRIGKLLGAKTVWLDSIANAHTLSLSGKLAGRHATMWLTQWDHLVSADGPFCEGGVL